MGSFANSFHVRSHDADWVASNIQELLLAENYHPSKQAPPEDDMWGMSDKYRAVRISKPSSSWVGVLDSDFASAAGLAAEISTRLNTITISVFVNDSDSWQYSLFDAGKLHDTFDSASEHVGNGPQQPAPEGLLDQISQLSPEVLQMLQTALAGSMDGIVSHFGSVMPPAIREICSKISSHKATGPEIREYTAWIRTVPLHPGENSKADAATPADRFNALQPVLIPNTTEESVVGVLQKKAVFAEEVLAEFLSLLGINREFANLSYRYATEYSPEELRRQGIDLEHHLMFERVKAKRKMKKK